MMTEQEFVQLVKKECKYYGITFKLGKGKYVKDGGSHCSGFFDSDRKILTSALGNEAFLDVLVHEYCHMRQWVEKAPVWLRAVEEDSYVIWGNLLDGRKVKDIDKHFSIMRDLELDNEKRSVKLIEELGLPIDTKKYIRKANCYVMFYNYMKITHKWYKINNNPCKNKRLIAAMPSTFSLDYSVLPDRLEKIFREEGI